ncbi:MAG: TAXI family TRAP transporter solute-binding subunit [Candidatus Heteroscillospira sp.]|jgi:TRAP transporter TAXI family solute receptor
MKRSIALLLALVLCVGLLAGCGGGNQSNEGNNGGNAEAPKNYDLIIATGGTGGSYYPYGGAIAQILSENIEGVSATATATGASAENCRNLNSKEADLAIVQNDVLDYAYNGTELMSEGGKLENLATIACLYPEVVQIVVTKESGIESIKDFAGKRISVGAAGSGVEANARHILEAYGVKYEDFNVNYLGFAESSTGMQNKTLDGAFITAGIPNSSIMELSSMVDCKLITLDADVLAKMSEAHSFYSTYEIADEDYENIDGGATTASILATLACSADLDEELVYNITKTLFEKQPELATAYSKGADLSLENALAGVSVPLHPGAERYYKEVGALK